MYKELIERLRYIAENNAHLYDADVMAEAADAIEKLQASYSQVKADFDALIEDVSNEVMDNCSICARSKPEKCYLNDDCDNCDLECFCCNCLSVSHFVWRGRLEADDE